jgi:hypothetical protein
MALRSTPRAPRRNHQSSAAAFTASWDGRVSGSSSSPDPVAFRELVASGRITELTITFRPCILGGKSALPITGFDPAFLPHGIQFDLLKLERTKDGIRAKYRVQKPRT